MARLGWITDRRPLAAAAAGTVLVVVALQAGTATVGLAAGAAGVALAGRAALSLRRQHRASLTWCPACRGTVALSADVCRHCGAALHGSPTPARDARKMLTGPGSTAFTSLF